LYKQNNALSYGLQVSPLKFSKNEAAVPQKKAHSCFGAILQENGGL